VTRALWIVGEPGLGKTTLARRLLPAEPQLVAKPKWTTGPGIALAGHYTGATFDGADTVGYSGVSAALDFWEGYLRPRVDLTVFDGDRFSYPGALERVRAAGAECLCFLLYAPPEVGAERRAARGSAQNASWVRGRATKSERFADHPGLVTMRASAAENTPDELWDLLRRFLAI
jgi:hypothetical protein